MLETANITSDYTGRWS